VCGIASSLSPFVVAQESSTAITLRDFSALHSNNQVALNWITSSETNNEGFILYRSDSADGPFAPITPSMIPARGGPGLTMTYSYTDFNVQTGRDYYYRLQDIDSRGFKSNYDVLAIHSGNGTANTQVASLRGRAGGQNSNATQQLGQQSRQVSVMRSIGGGNVSLVMPGDSAGITATDDNYIISMNTATNRLNVLSNDNAAALNGSLEIKNIGSPDQGGTVSLNSSRNGIIYTPAPGFIGEETFTYAAGTTVGSSDRAIVSISVVGHEGVSEIEQAMVDSNRFKTRRSTANTLFDRTRAGNQRPVTATTDSIDTRQTNAFSVSIVDDKGNLIQVNQVEGQSDDALRLTSLQSVINEAGKQVVTWQVSDLRVRGFMLYRSEQGKNQYTPVVNLARMMVGAICIALVTTM